MSLNKTDSFLWSCSHLSDLTPISFWDIECLLCRIGGAIILSISIICFTFNIRYFIWYQQKRCQNILVLSLFLASFFVLMISVPRVLLQLFICYRNCNNIYCRIEGFTSYFSGCLCMLIYMVLSVNRYLLLRQFNHLLLYRYPTLICWILSFIWTFPPVFGYWISYVPEGLGFHCSINWNDRSRQSFFYIFLSFLGFYLIPLVVLFTMNLLAHHIIHSVYSSQKFDYLNQEMSDQRNVILMNRRKHTFTQESDHRSSIATCYMRKAADRKRVRLEYRFVKAIIFLVVTYILAWTPYSIIALLQLFRIDFIFQHSSFTTLSAFIAKLSVISAPLVYLSIMNTSLFKKLLFFDKIKKTFFCS